MSLLNHMQVETLRNRAFSMFDPSAQEAPIIQLKDYEKRDPPKLLTIGLFAGRNRRISTLEYVWLSLLCTKRWAHFKASFELLIINHISKSLSKIYSL